VKWKPREEVLARLAPHVTGELDALGHLPLCDVGQVDAKRVRTGGGPPPPPRGVPVGGRYLVVHGADLVAVAESDARGPKVLRVP
jgi:hypothetical protein